nr:Fic family protein [Demequina lutea]
MRCGPTTTVSSSIGLWNGINAKTSRWAVSWAPSHQGRVPAGMADPVTFVGRTEAPVIAHLALAHAQFETIHPFADEWRQRVWARKGASAWRLAEILHAHPVVTDEVVLRALGVSAPTAHAAIDVLADAARTG